MFGLLHVQIFINWLMFVEEQKRELSGVVSPQSESVAQIISGSISGMLLQ